MEPICEAEMQTQPGKRLNEESKKSGKAAGGGTEAEKAGKGMENGGRHRRGGCCRAFLRLLYAGQQPRHLFPTYHHQRRGSGRPDGGRSPVPAGS